MKRHDGIREAWATRQAAAVAVAILVAVTVPLTARQQAAGDEEVAWRQLEAGRAFARQGNHTEALKDFRAVAQTHAATPAADNALLEIARYFFNVALDPVEADTAVTQILQRYPTSDSAPEAYLISGQLALARSRQPGDLEAALANFDRVSRLFPRSDVVPRALQLAGHVYRLQGRLDLALASLARVAADHPGHAAGAQAYLEASLALVAKGDALAAMEELQQVRNLWPGSREAEIALGRLATLHRLYVRTRQGGSAYAFGENLGPIKVDNLVGLAVAPSGSVYWAGENGLRLLSPPGDPPPTVARPRGLTTDATGRPVIIEAGSIRPFGGEPLALSVPRSNGTPQPLQKIEGVVQLSNRAWIVADEDERTLHRFQSSGEHAGPFAQARTRRLAVNATDEVIGIDREQRGLVLFDAAGRMTGRLPARGTGYMLNNIEDVAFDVFGHLFVLDREGLAVFSPWQAAGTPAPAAPAARSGGQAAPEGRGAAYRLLTFYSEPEQSPGAFRRSTALALDASGAAYVYDARAERLRVYR